MKTSVLVTTGITFACFMVIFSTIPTASGQIATPIVIPASNGNGIGGFLLSLVLLGAIIFSTFGRENGKINLSVTNDGNAQNLADAQSNTDSNSNSLAYADGTG
ncbi:hypothetical protein ACJMK2_039678 [Sinanodonta woodiana]|uniref:Uncharacterized protein n=1 Tax=Sinanodonta woodiana TaxID=1069815 RepID=A0ABD3WCR3_SINWO